MEAKAEQNIIKTACCICANTSMLNSHLIVDNFIKFKDSFVPLTEIINKTLCFEVRDIAQPSRYQYSK